MLLHYWWENKSGPLTGAFDQVSARLGSISAILSTLSLFKSRTCTLQSNRCLDQQGLGRPPPGSSRPTEHLMLSFPSTKMRRPVTLAQVPHVGLPIPQPTGGVHTKGNGRCRKEKSITEEQEVSVSNHRSHIHRVTGWPFGVGISPSPGGPQTAREHIAQIASGITSRGCATT